MMVRLVMGGGWDDRDWQSGSGLYKDYAVAQDWDDLFHDRGRTLAAPGLES